LNGETINVFESNEPDPLENESENLNENEMDRNHYASSVGADIDNTIVGANIDTTKLFQRI
jgi:hypothetical protein